MNRKISAFAAIAALAAATGTSVGAVSLEAGGLQIVEPGSVVNGRSVGNMAAKWWRFLVETPMSAHPNYGNPDVPGPLAGEGTYFLYGLPEGESGSLEATVKAGSAMLLPLRPRANLKTEPDETAQDLFDQLEPLVASIRNPTVTVNGEDVASGNGVDLIAHFRERFPSEPGGRGVRRHVPRRGRVVRSRRFRHRPDRGGRPLDAVRRSERRRVRDRHQFRCLGRRRRIGLQCERHPEGHCRADPVAGGPPASSGGSCRSGRNGIAAARLTGRLRRSLGMGPPRR